MTIINLYGRPGCHLCDDVRHVLESVQPHYGFAIREFNIMDDEELFDKYCAEIPVVTIDGEYFCQYSITAEELTAKLDSQIKGNH